MDDFFILAKLIVSVIDIFLSLYVLSYPEHYIKYFKLKRYYESIDKHRRHLFTDDPDFMYTIRFEYLIKVHYLLAVMMIGVKEYVYFGIAKFFITLYVFEMTSRSAKRNEQTYYTFAYIQITIVILTILTSLNII